MDFVSQVEGKKEGNMTFPFGNLYFIKKIPAGKGSYFGELIQKFRRGLSQRRSSNHLISKYNNLS